MLNHVSREVQSPKPILQQDHQSMNLQKEKGRERESSTNGRGKIFNDIGDKTDEQATLPHSGIADQQDLKRQIVAAVARPRPGRRHFRALCL